VAEPRNGRYKVIAIKDGKTVFEDVNDGYIRVWEQELESLSIGLIVDIEVLRA
jgi:hypothetical protein